MKRINPSTVLELILFATLLLAGCATNKNIEPHEYEKLELDNNSIKETLEPGMTISIKAKDISGQFILIGYDYDIGYDDDNSLICIDKYNTDKKIKIAIDDIEEIYVKEEVTYTDDFDDSAASPPPIERDFVAGFAGGIIVTTLFFVMLLSGL